MEMTAKKKVQLMCVVVKTKGITSVGNDAAKKQTMVTFLDGG